jgi:hypothetical protein
MYIIICQEISIFNRLKSITKNDIKVGKILYNCKLQPCRITAIGKEKFLFQRTNRKQAEAEKYISYAIAKWRKK